MNMENSAVNTAEDREQDRIKAARERAHELKDMIRDEANTTKACVTDVAFKTFAICAAALSVIIANVEKTPAVGLAACPILVLCLFVNRITAYKYTTSNRNFAYDMHLDRTLTVYASDPYERDLLGLGWEDAMFAWRIVQAKLFHYLYPKVRLCPYLNIGYYQRKLEKRLAEYPWFDSLLLADGKYVPVPPAQPLQEIEPERPSSKDLATGKQPAVTTPKTTPRIELDPESSKEAAGVKAALFLTLFGYVVALVILMLGRAVHWSLASKTCLWLYKTSALGFMNIGLFMFLLCTALLQRANYSVSFHPGTYLRHIHTALNTLGALCIIILNWSFWRMTSLDNQHNTETYALFLATGGCTLLFISRVNSIARRRRILECGLLSIQSSAILWRAVTIAYVRALEVIKWQDNRLRNLTRVMAEMGDMLVEYVRDRTIHDWVDPNNHAQIIREVNKRLQCKPPLNHSLNGPYS